MDFSWTESRQKRHAYACEFGRSLVGHELDLMRVLGASGYLAGSAAEADVRDSPGGIGYGGTSETQKNIIARALRL